jgi:hypothetical protein
VVTNPEHLMVQALRDATNPKPEEMTLLFFLAVFVVYYLIKTVNVLIARLLARDIAPLAS